MTKLGVIHYNFPDFSFDQFLQFASQTGYKFVELFITDVWDETQPFANHRAAEVKQQVESYGLRVSALGAGNDFVQRDAGVIEHQVERMERVCELARLLDPEAVVRSEGGHPKDEVPPADYLDSMLTCFSQCVPFAESLGVGIAIDNHGLITNDGDLLFELLQRVNSPRIGTNLDTMNYRWWGHSVEACNVFYQKMAPYALHVHLKDGFHSRAEYQGAALGEGEINLAWALECLRGAGYDGVYCAEYEGPEPENGVGYAKCAEWMKTNL